VYSEESITQIKIRKEVVKKIQEKLDTFKSLRDKKIITKSRYSRKEKKIFFRMNNLIDDLHHKTCSFLTKTFNHIILPSFDSQEMTKKSRNKSLNRDLLQLKHFMFKERLISKCKLMSGVCGCINNVGSSDTLQCEDCNSIIDRDVNGARNIAIKRFNELF
jgi:putative transposase